MRNQAFLFAIAGILFFSVARSQVAAYSFSAGTSTYTSITGISPLLTGDGTNATYDEGYANTIPIGFQFNYLGINYNSISASTNGFASFSTITSPAFSNSIATGCAGKPILAPLWDDIALASPTDLQYSTTGAAGNRVFILQWSNVFFDFGAMMPSLSFQLRLYETSNLIEFVYTQLPSAVQNYSGGASIGITGSVTGTGNYLSLNNSSATPLASTSVPVNNIIQRPATGQLYTFTPPSCNGPGGLFVNNIGISNATVGWTDGGVASYEYAVTLSPAPPSSGTFSSVTSANVNALIPCRQYYLHVRKNCGSSFSGWSSYGFATACEASLPPYTMPISNVIAPGLPVGVTVKDENQDGNTWRSYPSGGPGWSDQVLAYVYNPNATTAANDWLFTQGLSLNAGTTYRLKFKYDNDLTSLYPEKLKVAYGNATTSSAMTNTLADYSSVYSATPKTAIIDFTPAAPGLYYIGFQAYSDANKDVLILDEISIALRPSCDPPTNLASSPQPSGTTVNLSWTPPSFGSPSGYEYVVNSSMPDPSSGTPVANPSVTVNNLTVNTQYYLHVRTSCSGAFSEWTTLAFTTVVNDESCKAIALTLGATPVCANTTLATTIASDPYSNCSSPNNTVWYKYTATTNGTVVLHLTTPASPARSLHGWVNWYTRSGTCPNVSYDNVGYCSEFGNNGNNDVDDLLSPELVAGTTYYIMVDGFSDEYGEFCISIPACSPALSVKVDNIISTAAAVNWTGTGTFILEYGPAGFTPGTTTAAGAGGTIINPAVSPQAFSGLTLSTTYDVYIRQNCTASANGFSNNSIKTSFTTLGTPPPNDNISWAIDLVVGTTCTSPTAGTTLNATQSNSLPLPGCGVQNEGYDDDVWYMFTAPAGMVAVDIEFLLTGGNIDMAAQLYTSSDNTPSGTLSLYECNDDDGPGEMPLFHNLPVVPGTVYFVRLFTYSKGVNSQFTICVSKALLVNDDASGARTLGVDEGCVGANYTNVGATQTIDEPTGSCSSLTGYATVWFKFDAPVGGAVRITTASGSGYTLTNTRMALFQTSDVNDYSRFTIIGCDEDGAAAPFNNMSVIYAAGLTPGTTYYVQVDKFDSNTPTGTFCIQVDKLGPAMISPNTGCNMPNKIPAGVLPGYTGWVSLMDENSKIMALVRNTTGASANAYTVVQNIHTGPVRQDPISGEYYLNRNFKFTSTTPGNPTVGVTLFFTNTELNALQALDPAAGSVSRLRITKQTGTDCQPDFVAANGTNIEITQSGTNSSGTLNGVGWVRFNSTGFSNLYIHAAKSYVTAKVFLQGAFNSATGRHKDVTTGWKNVLNTYALVQPYNTTAFGNYTGTETVSFGSFTSTAANSDIVDWVLLEVKTSSGTILSRRAAFVREDGQIIDLDGSPTISMYNQVTGNNYLTVRHRNHLGISTQNTLSFTARALGVVPTAPPDFDFTTAADANIFGDALAYKIVNGKNLMIGGNANSNNSVRFAGLNNDIGVLLAILAGSQSFVLSGYNASDLNMDGQVRFAGLNNDTGILSFILEGNQALVITEQKR